MRNGAVGTSFRRPRDAGDLVARCLGRRATVPRVVPLDVRGPLTPPAVTYTRPHPAMCLAVPGRIVDIREAGGTRMGRLDFGGIVKDVCLAYLPDAGVGDYAIVHVGFAIARIDEASAQETLRHFRELGILEQELGEVPDDSHEGPAACPVPPSLT